MALAVHNSSAMARSCICSSRSAQQRAFTYAVGIVLKGELIASGDTLDPHAPAS